MSTTPPDTPPPILPQMNLQPMSSVGFVNKIYPPLPTTPSLTDSIRRREHFSQSQSKQQRRIQAPQQSSFSFGSEPKPHEHLVQYSTPQTVSSKVHEMFAEARTPCSPELPPAWPERPPIFPQTPGTSHGRSSAQGDIPRPMEATGAIEQECSGSPAIHTLFEGLDRPSTVQYRSRPHPQSQEQQRVRSKVDSSSALFDLDAPSFDGTDEREHPPKRANYSSQPYEQPRSTVQQHDIELPGQMGQSEPSDRPLEFFRDPPDPCQQPPVLFSLEPETHQQQVSTTNVSFRKAITQAQPQQSAQPPENPQIQPSSRTATPSLHSVQAPKTAPGFVETEHDQQPDPMLPLSPISYDSFETRYLSTIAEIQAAEAATEEDFALLLQFFHVWQEVGRDHEEARARKRIRTRVAYVKEKEKELAVKREHVEVVRGKFEEALALLG